jgi:hypothetical protein
MAKMRMMKATRTVRRLLGRVPGAQAAGGRWLSYNKALACTHVVPAGQSLEEGEVLHRWVGLQDGIQGVLRQQATFDARV